MAGARRSAQTPAWRAGLAAALRRVARVVAPPAVRSQSLVAPPTAAAVPEGWSGRASESPQSAASVIVDPLDRARAALRDARQHMSALIENEAPQPAPATEPGYSSAEQADELRGLIHELREERRRLGEEIADLRALVQGLGEDVRRLNDTLTAARLPEPPATPRLPPATREEPRTDAQSDEDAARITAADVTLAECATEAVVPAVVGYGQREAAFSAASDADGAEPFAPPDGSREGRDFGWRARPEAALTRIQAALQTAPATIDCPPPAEAAAESAAAPEAERIDPPIDPPQGAEIRLPATGTRLVIGPVRSIGRLTALERRLARDPALGQATLADYRRQTATFIVTPRTPLALAALEPALCGEERMRIEAAWQADGALRLALAAWPEDGA